MVLELDKLFQGIFIFVFVIITLIVGVKISLGYIKHKRIEFFYVGIAWIGMAVPWLPDAIVFLVLLFNVPVSVWYINAEWYLVLGTGFIPFFITFWLAALKNLIYIKKGTIILIINIIVGIIYEIFFFYLLFTDSSQLGTFEGIYESRFGLLIRIYIVYSLIVIIITGLHFGISAQKSDNPEAKLKGKFLIIAFITFILGSISDTGLIFIASDPIGITKLVLMASSIEFYIGYVLPEWARNLFLKQKSKFSFN